MNVDIYNTKQMLRYVNTLLMFDAYDYIHTQYTVLNICMTVMQIGLTLSHGIGDLGACVDHQIVRHSSHGLGGAQKL